MAKIVEHSVVITLSKLVKDSDDDNVTLPEDFMENLEALVNEMVASDSIVIEVNDLQS